MFEDYEPEAPYIADANTADETVTVTIHLDAITGGIREAVIRSVAASIIDRETDNIVREARRQADKAIEAELGRIVNDAMTKAFQPVDSWGEAKGEQTTLRALLEKKASEFIETRVDYEGKPVTGYYNERNGTPRWKFYAEQVVTAAIAAQMKQATDAYMVEVKAKINDAVSTLLAEKVAKK